MRYTVCIAIIFVSISLVISWLKPVQEISLDTRNSTLVEAEIVIDPIGMIHRPEYPFKNNLPVYSKKSYKPDVSIQNNGDNDKENNNNNNEKKVIKKSFSNNKGDASKFDKYSNSARLFSKFKYVGNTNTMKYHVTNGSCPAADKIKPEHIHELKSLEQAKAEKYKPCKICFK